MDLGFQDNSSKCETIEMTVGAIEVKNSYLLIICSKRSRKWILVHNLRDTKQISFTIEYWHTQQAARFVPCLSVHIPVEPVILKLSREIFRSLSHTNTSPKCGQNVWSLSLGVHNINMSLWIKKTLRSPVDCSKSFKWIRTSLVIEH